jgi:sialic acid synthase SpsE
MDIKNVSTNDQVLIIAEIGNNHEGSAYVAAQMVRDVMVAGADAVESITKGLFALFHESCAST